MYDTGAINGAAINEEAINGGHIEQYAAGTAAILLAPSASATRRARAGAVLTVVIGGLAEAETRPRIIHRAPRHRTYTLPIERRNIVLLGERRVATVPGPRAAFIVPRDTREAS